MSELVEVLLFGFALLVPVNISTFVYATRTANHSDASCMPRWWRVKMFAIECVASFMTVAGLVGFVRMVG